MRILIAPNTFKNSLPAEEVANAIKEGLMQSRLKCDCICFPIADGGDGTGTLLNKKLSSSLINLTVSDPIGRRINSSYGIAPQDTAIIEMADASGLRLLKVQDLDPLHSNSFGTGELISDALNRNVKKIVLCVGGTATVDGGVGILQALGVKFLDQNKLELKNIPQDLINLDSIDFSRINKRLGGCDVNILCDVVNPLLGEKGAARVFGPQKGASPEIIKVLESCLRQLASVVKDQFNKDISTIVHGGAAGGVAAILHALLDAKLINGIDYFLSATGFDEVLRDCDLLITGEGCIDEQTLEGKGPFGVAVRAYDKNIPVVGLAGVIPLNPGAVLSQYFQVLLSINHRPQPIEEAIKNTKENLVRAAQALGNSLAIKGY
jgi:glycerate kinase